MRRKYIVQMIIPCIMLLGIPAFGSAAEEPILEPESSVIEEYSEEAGDEIVADEISEKISEEIADEDITVEENQDQITVPEEVSFGEEPFFIEEITEIEEEISDEEITAFDLAALPPSVLTPELTYVKTSGQAQSVQVMLNGGTFESITDGERSLSEGSDYLTELEDGILTIVFQPEYMETLAASNPKESYLLTLCFENGDKGSVRMIIVRKQSVITAISDQTKEYDGKTVEAPSFQVTGGRVDEAVIRYKEKGQADSSYSNKLPTDAGEYIVEISVPENESYKACTQTSEFRITQTKNTLKADKVQVNVLARETAAVVIQGDGEITCESNHTAYAAVSAKPDSDNSILIKGVLPGTAVINVKAAGDRNHKPGSLTIQTTITVNKLKKPDVTLLKTHVPFTNKAVTPGVQVTHRNQKLKKDRDYTLTYTNNIYAGIATVTIQGKGAYSGTITRKFRIVEDKEANKNALNHGLRTKWEGRGIRFAWGEISTASGYEIYLNRCDGHNIAIPIATVKHSNITTKKITKLNGENLQKNLCYKMYVKAYRNENGEKKYIGTSFVVHTSGAENKKETNVKKIQPEKKHVQLQTGKTTKMKVILTAEDPTKSILTHGKNIYFWSANPAVATVTEKGTVKAKATGTCYIYAMALNGMKTKMKVTVK